jgi:mRNA interferase HicA
LCRNGGGKTGSQVWSCNDETQHLCCITNSKQAKRYLAARGCSFEPGEGSHLIVSLADKRSVLPMHGSKEIGIGLWKAILKQLGIEE